MLCLSASGATLKIILEDQSSPCEIFLNGSSIGIIKDSIIFNDAEEGSYKVSMFSERVFDEKSDSVTSANDKRVRNLDKESMRSAIALGTESVFLSETESKSVILKNKQVAALIKEKKPNNKPFWCCFGGGAGCCLSVLAASTIMVWLNNTVFAK